VARELDGEGDGGEQGAQRDERERREEHVEAAFEPLSERRELRLADFPGEHVDEAPFVAGQRREAAACGNEVLVEGERGEGRHSRIHSSSSSAFHVRIYAIA